MADELIVDCPRCNEHCGVAVESSELWEGRTTECWECQCKCGCEFTFDLYVDVSNKEIKN